MTGEFRYQRLSHTAEEIKSGRIPLQEGLISLYIESINAAPPSAREKIGLDGIVFAQAEMKGGSLMPRSRQLSGTAKECFGVYCVPFLDTLKAYAFAIRELVVEASGNENFFASDVSIGDVMTALRGNLNNYSVN